MSAPAVLHLTDQTADAARFLAHYAKQHNAGAFATPTAKELATPSPATVLEWRDGPHRVVAVERTLSRHSRRQDFTGRTMMLPVGSRVLTHMAATPGAPTPDLRRWDYVMAYTEDLDLRDGLAGQGRQRVGTRVTAAAEIIGVWGRRGEEHRYGLHDQATITDVTDFLDLRASDVANMGRDLDGLSGWDDDFPYYSDGSWGSLTLRGFSDDPGVSVKPSEMPKSWKDEHPDQMNARVRWTSLGSRTPSIMAWLHRQQDPGWWGGMERVRLLRMAGRTGKPGRLGRHSDISDRAAGTMDGQVVRFHIPLVTHPDIVMRCWDLDGRERVEHLERGRCYYLDARKPHAVTNPTPVDRVHLVVDVFATPQVRVNLAAAEAHRRASLVAA